MEAIFDFINDFDNRQIALILWIFLILFWAIKNKNVRDTVKALIKIFLSKLILMSIFSMVGYILLMVFFLYKVDIWDSSQLNVTLIWGITSAFSMFFKLNKINEDKMFFRKAIIENFKLTVLIDFIVNLNVFSLWFELIFIPFTFVFGAMIAISNRDEKHRLVEKLLNGIAIFLGFSLIIYSSWQIYIHIDEFFTLQKLRDFSVPILLSILYLPFVYLLALYSAYEEVFIRLQFVIKDHNLHNYTKYLLITHFIFHKDLLHMWLKKSWHEELKTKKDIFNFTQKIRQQIIKQT